MGDPRPRAHQILAARPNTSPTFAIALHSEGICASYYRTHTRTFDIAHDLPSCATLAQLHNWGVLVEGNVDLDHAAVFWTVVPDDVATVTLRFARSGRTVTHSAMRTVRPVNNVVVAREPYRAPAKCGGYHLPSRIVLRAADGRVIKSVANTPDTATPCCRCC